MKNNSQTHITIALAAGGTGGHMFPALAVARVLQARGIKPVFLTDTRGANFLEHVNDIDHIILRSGTFRKNIRALIKDSFNLALGNIQAIRTIRRLKIQAVLGFGGYPSFPGVFAGWILGKPVVLHEQNAVLGKANAVLARLARTLCLSFPATPLHPLPAYLNRKTITTGNPVRADIAHVAETPYQTAAPDGLFRILVVGGSLGATVFSNVVPQAIATLSPNLQKRLHIVQQCRANDLELAKTNYTQCNLNSLSLLPFVNDMADQLRMAHLVICRAGASTVAELAASGRPALFVPYPHHGDAQQSRNADVLVHAGAAWVMEESGFTATSLAARLEPLLQNPAQLEPMAKAAKTCAQYQAAEMLADCALKTL